VAASWEDGGFELTGDLPEIVCLDLEATGLSSSADHVIEIGAVRFRGSEVLGRYHTLVNPGLRLPPMIRRMTGIADRDLAAAPRLREVLPDLRAFISGAGLLAHGAGYDITFLEDALGIPTGEVEVFDSLEVARVVCPGAPSYSLGALCGLVGLSHPRPHHALEDAEATFRLFLELVRLAGELEPATLAEVRRLTANSTHSLRTFFHVLVQTPAAAEPKASTPTASRPDRLAAQQREPLMERLSAVELAELVGPTGPLASEPGWELREVQEQMTLAVAQAFERKVNLVCEAGTGTGKSLAYLVPALAWAASGDTQVYVSTYTINLQEQLLHKDLPLAARILGIPLRAVLLKGRSHYLGRLRWEQLLAGTEIMPGGRGVVVELEGVDPGELLIFKLKITVWLSRTHTGDRDELRLFGQEERLWRSVSSEWADCRSTECLNGPSPCFYHRSRQRAAGADVVVVNHALLLADAFNEASSLARARNLVLDEAHHLEDAATKGLTEDVREDDLLNLLGIATAAGPRGAGGPSPALRRLTALVLGLFEELRLEGRRLFGSEVGRDIRIEPGRWSAFAGDLRGHLTALAPAEAVVVEARVSRLIGILEAADDARVGWAAFGRDGRATVKRAPLEVGPILREALIEGRDSVVMTSATLAINGSFEYFRRRVGLPASRLMELVLPSPFDFLGQALLCLPSDMPEPSEPDFIPRMVDVVEDVALRLRGRTLVLFTSVEQLSAASAELRQRLAPEGIEVLAQLRGAGSRRSLTERFISAPEAVLCGTNSFWEGLDLPGNALSCVVIARLPFAPPGEPVTRARSELLVDPFLELALPEAVLRLKQGFGRLIRRATDRGAVVILDPRVSTRAYGTHFVEALPECATYTGDAAGMADAIQEWIEDRNISFSDGGLETESAPEAGPGTMRPEAGEPAVQPPAASRPG
jgi:DNA polymerase III epsilon subunit family exonuclease